MSQGIFFMQELWKPVIVVNPCCLVCIFLNLLTLKSPQSHRLNVGSPWTGPRSHPLPCSWLCRHLLPTCLCGGQTHYLMKITLVDPRIGVSVKSAQCHHSMNPLSCFPFEVCALCMLTPLDVLFLINRYAVA